MTSLGYWVRFSSVPERSLNRARVARRRHAHAVPAAARAGRPRSRSDRPQSELGTYTNFVNLLDLCALSVPGGLRPDASPSGITRSVGSERRYEHGLRRICTLAPLADRELQGGEHLTM